jgi:hypothetical protein
VHLLDGFRRRGTQQIAVALDRLLILAARLLICPSRFRRGALGSRLAAKKTVEEPHAATIAGTLVQP